MGVGGVEGEGEGEGVDVNVVLVVVVDAFRGLKKKFHLIFTFSGAKKMLRCQTTSRFRTFCLVRNHFRKFLLFSKLFLFKCRKVFWKFFSIFAIFEAEMSVGKNKSYNFQIKSVISNLLIDFWFLIFFRAIDFSRFHLDLDRQEAIWLESFPIKMSKNDKNKNTKKFEPSREPKNGFETHNAKQVSKVMCLILCRSKCF